ncbi:MAG: DUF4349 domain-containing protein [Candidatus Methanodesulfokora sp.]
MRIQILISLVVLLFVAGYLLYPYLQSSYLPGYTEVSTKPYIPEALPPPVPPSAPQTVAKGTTTTSGQVTYLGTRQVSYTASVEMEVNNTSYVAARISQIAQQLSGYVSHMYVVNSSAQITVKIPQEFMQSFLDQLSSMGKILQKSVTANDVTDQLIDLDIRIRNLQAEESRLLKLYDMAKDVSEIIQIEDRLSQVRYQIEMLQAQKTNIEKMVQYATVQISLIIPSKPQQEDHWKWVMDIASKAFWGAIALIAIAVAGGLPLSLVILAAYVVYKLIKKKQ